MAIKKITIPEKFQLPMAVLLGVFLVGLLGIKTGRIQPNELWNKLKAEELDQVEMVSVDGMLTMIADATDVLADHELSQHEMLGISRDPFREPSMANRPTAVSNEEGRPSVTRTRGRSFSRSNWLEEVELEGTLQMKSQSSAILDGRFIREGDKIEGFKVVRIVERAIVLADMFGESVVHMPEE